MNCSLIFKSKRQYIVHLFFLFFSLKIKDKTKISLTIKILHLGQGSFTRKVRTIFTLKIIFVKLFLILVLHLRQFFIVRMFVKRATGREIGIDRMSTNNYIMHCIIVVCHIFVQWEFNFLDSIYISSMYPNF